jgi:RND superfamily putative drug exporter
VKSLARFAVRRRWFVLALWIILAVGINALSSAVGTSYSNSFNLPGTNSVHALQLLQRGFPKQAGDTDQIVFSSSSPLSSQASTINTTLATLRTLPEVASVVTPFCVNPQTTCPGSHQISHSGLVAYATVTFTGQANQLSKTDVLRVEDTAKHLRSPSLAVNFGGNAFAGQGAPQGSPGEAAGLVITAVILFLAFGSLSAMVLPLGVALFAIAIASAATSLLSHGLSIAEFAPILGSLIGLGVGIDYALFIVTRARQNLRAGMSVEDAIVNAVNTSGRAVLFAGATVVVALLGMLTLGFSFLNGLGVAAALTVFITMAASLTLLPALLAMFKLKILSRKERRLLVSEGPHAADMTGRWNQWARFVGRHPLRLSGLALLIGLVVAIPTLSINLGISDAGSDPAGSTTRIAYDTLATGFGPGFNGPLTVVGHISAPGDLAAMHALDASIKGVSDVAFVGPVVANPSKTVALITVVPSSSPQSTQTSALIDHLRQVTIPSATASSHTAVYVGGARAISDDFSHVLNSKIPLFLGVIIILGGILLMIAFRSLLIPLVAALMNLLAVASSFGLVTAVFQWGWGASLLSAGAGPIESYLPIIMIAILFGLSMDYQVFLVSRMHEEWVHHQDNEQAIVAGQSTTGRVITAAALIMISVFFSFAFGGQRIIAEFGIGLGGAVLLDAFIIRTVLVPSLMHLLGRANWWIPRGLDRVIPRVSLESNEE